MIERLCTLIERLDTILEPLTEHYERFIRINEQNHTALSYSLRYLSIKIKTVTDRYTLPVTVLIVFN